MTENYTDPFEKRLADLLAKTKLVESPPLTPARLQALRALVKQDTPLRPTVSLLWERVANEARETLSVLKLAGLTLVNSPLPTLRDGKPEGMRIDTVSCSFRDGELLAQVVPTEDRKARILLSVKGKYAERNDLSVELFLGQKLLEARPLEQKTEVTLDGLGCFTISLYADDIQLGSFDLNIGEATGSDHD